MKSCLVYKKFKSFEGGEKSPLYRNRVKASIGYLGIFA